MNESDEFTNEANPDEAIEAVAPLSITDKFVGILSEPTATYENVRAAGPRTVDWLLPLIGMVVILIAGTLLRFSNPEYLATIQEQTEQSIRDRVASGQMTQASADQAMEQINSMARLQKYFAAVGILFMTPIVFFLIVLFFWVIVRFAMKGTITYSGAMSVVGLTFFIGIIDQLVSIIIGYATGNMFATFSPAALMPLDLKSSTYKLLMNLNPITIWSYVVMSIGFHRVAGIQKVAAFVLVFGLWIAWVLASSFIRIPGMG